LHSYCQFNFTADTYFMIIIDKNSESNKVKVIDHFSFAERLYFKITKRWMSDKLFAKWMLKRYIGGGSIDNPNTFNEKIQWLKLYDRQQLYVKLADKYAVRNYVEENIGNKYLNKLYGVYEYPDQIKYKYLPDSFILKATHGSGMNIFVHNKNECNFRKTSLQLRKWLNSSYYKVGREWVYKDISPMIICEKILMDENGNIPNDYKVYCFNGIPYCIEVHCDRFLNHTCSYYDTQWNKLCFGVVFPISNQEVPKPHNLEEMLDVAKHLSKDIPFVRIDLYLLPSIVFGEMTFYPGNGFDAFYPFHWDYTFGKLIELPIIH
jgi:hypothetical protein